MKIIVALNRQKQFLKTQFFITLNNNILSMILFTTNFSNLFNFSNYCPHKKEKWNVKTGHFDFVAEERRKRR